MTSMVRTGAVFLSICFVAFWIGRAEGGSTIDEQSDLAESPLSNSGSGSRAYRVSDAEDEKKPRGKHGKSRYVDCTEVARLSTDADRFMGHSAKMEVKLAPGKHIRLTQCAGDEEKARCAVGSACTTVYRWLPARVMVPVEKERERDDEDSSSTGVETVKRRDRVLVPTGCTCLGQFALWEQHVASRASKEKSGGGSGKKTEHQLIIYDDDEIE